jgi:prolipoprotein diacylglyceryltransferase
MAYLYKRYREKVHRGFFFGLCLTYIFTFRFFIEYLKENQVDFENGMLFNMGQLLSIPIVLVGVLSLIYGKKLDKMK